MTFGSIGVVPAITDILSLSNIVVNFTPWDGTPHINGAIIWNATGEVLGTFYEHPLEGGYYYTPVTESFIDNMSDVMFNIALRELLDEHFEIDGAYDDDRDTML